jgi:hypothetical protein
MPQDCSMTAPQKPLIKQRKVSSKILQLQNNVEKQKKTVRIKSYGFFVIVFEDLII